MDCGVRWSRAHSCVARESTYDQRLELHWIVAPHSLDRSSVPSVGAPGRAAVGGRLRLFGYFEPVAVQRKISEETLTK